MFCFFFNSLRMNMQNIEKFRACETEIQFPEVEHVFCRTFAVGRTQIKEKIESSKR